MILAPIILAALVLLAFAPALWAPFLNWDDNYYIQDNPLVVNGGEWWRFFLQHIKGIYAPLTNMSFALEYRLAGENPFLYHLDNIILHGIVGWLSVMLAERLGLSRRTALAAAVLFVLHPMRVESVAWITERKDVLYAVFYLLGLYAYLHYLKAPSWQRYLLVFLCGFLSILAKPMALSFPLILFLIDWYQRRKISWQMVLEKLPVMVSVAAVAYVTYLFNARNLLNTMTGESLLTWIWCFMFYIFKFFWPLKLLPVYPPPLPVGLFEAEYFKAVVGFLLLLLAIWHWSKNRLLILAFYWYLLSIFFLMRFDFNVDTNVVGDRFMYLPSLGICWFLGARWDAWVSKEEEGAGFYRWRAWLAGAVIAGMLLIKTFYQVMIWSDQMRFWNYVITTNPQYFVAYGNRGNTYMEKGDLSKAIENYTKAVEMDSTFTDGYYNRGIAYMVLREYTKALNDFNEVVRHDPSFAMAYLDRSIILANRANYKLAYVEAKRAKELGAILPDNYLPWLKSQESNDVHLKLGIRNFGKPLI